MTKIQKTSAEWRKVLTDEQFQVCRLRGTEPAFSGALWNEKAKGTYRCVCCKTPLFRADEKYDSGSGWPSYWAPIADGAVARRRDESHGMVREEVVCATCDAHLGHVFEDGPKPSGLRYCINSVALEFLPDNAKP